MKLNAACLKKTAYEVRKNRPMEIYANYLLQIIYFDYVEAILGRPSC